MKLAEVARALPEIESQLNGIEGNFKGSIKTDYGDFLVYIKMLLDFYRCNFSVDIQKENTEVERITQKNKFFAGYMKMTIVTKACFLHGDLLSAEKEIKEAASYITPEGSIIYKLACETMRAEILKVQGPLTEAETILSNAFKSIHQQKLSNTPIKYLPSTLMAWISFQRNDIDSAFSYAMQSFKYFERAGYVDAAFSGYWLLSNIWIAKGDLKKVMHYAQKSKSLSESLDYPVIGDMTEFLLYMLDLYQGKADIIKKYVAVEKVAPSDPFTIKLVVKSILLAGSLLYLGRLEEAGRLLKILRTRCAKRNALDLVIEIDIFLAGIQFLMGQKDAALSTMEQVLLFSEKEGYIRPFVTFAGTSFPILRELYDSKRINRSEYFNALLTACDLEKTNIPKRIKAPQTNNAFDLTKRELEILQFMSDGYRNKQIADMAFVSMSTVKTHIQHILQKLNVNSRTQAALKAKEIFYPRKEP